MASDPWVVVQLEGAEVTILLGDNDDPETVENVDVEVKCVDGTRWSATVLTLTEIDRVMAHYAATGECLDGRYFHCWDLLITRSGGISEIVQVVHDLLRNDQLRWVLKRLEGEE